MVRNRIIMVHAIVFALFKEYNYVGIISFCIMKCLSSLKGMLQKRSFKNIKLFLCVNWKASFTYFKVNYYSDKVIIATDVITLLSATIIFYVSVS
jgi:hypothetical protein